MVIWSETRFYSSVYVPRKTNFPAVYPTIYSPNENFEYGHSLFIPWDDPYIKLKWRKQKPNRPDSKDAPANLQVCSPYKVKMGLQQLSGQENQK